MGRNTGVAPTPGPQPAYKRAIKLKYTTPDGAHYKRCHVKILHGRWRRNKSTTMPLCKTHCLLCGPWQRITRRWHPRRLSCALTSLPAPKNTIPLYLFYTLVKLRKAEHKTWYKRKHKWKLLNISLHLSCISLHGPHKQIYFKPPSRLSSKFNSKPVHKSSVTQSPKRLHNPDQSCTLSKTFLRYQAIKKYFLHWCFGMSYPTFTSSGDFLNPPNGLNVEICACCKLRTNSDTTSVGRGRAGAHVDSTTQ